MALLANTGSHRPCHRHPTQRPFWRRLAARGDLRHV